MNNIIMNHFVQCHPLSSGVILEYLGGIYSLKWRVCKAEDKSEQDYAERILRMFHDREIKASYI